MVVGSVVVISEVDTLDCSHIPPQHAWCDKSNRASVQPGHRENGDAGGRTPRGRVNKNRPQEVSPVESSKGMLPAALD